MPASDPSHASRTARLLTETVVGLVLFGATSWACWGADGVLLRAAGGAAILLQGCWLQRVFLVGHEAAHRKLVPDHKGLNDLLGQLLLLPIGVPLRVFRKIHAFHHGHNRRDERTSALETFVVAAPPGPLRSGWIAVQWYGSVLCGGFFLHSLVSILLFLFLPPSVARRISPAFNGWTAGDQWASRGAFAVAVAAHVALGVALGPWGWVAVVGAPLLVFAFVYSLLTYVFHYGTTYGPEVRYNVRSLRAGRLFTWWFLNFNEHATHHRDVSVPWHRLPAERRPLPPAYAANQEVDTVPGAIRNLLRGPRIVVKP